jgi:protein-disulfide isomerase
MNKVRTRGEGAVLAITGLLLVVALALGACTTPTPAASTAAPAATETPAVGALAPTEAATMSVNTADLQTGVDANGNFYRGDPNAAIKLTEFSDYQ